jgi:hypothetical protein
MPISRTTHVSAGALTTVGAPVTFVRFLNLPGCREDIRATKTTFPIVPSLPSFIAQSADWQAQLIKILEQSTGTSPAIQPLLARNNVPLDQRKKEQHRSYLNKLAFSTLDERKRRIADATPQTFEWIFNDPNANTKPWANFSSWLQGAERLYWIAGKAGSGKSTLMKFLEHDPRTEALLRKWAGPKLITGWFYFWNSGSVMQQSLEGLLRTLLHDVVVQLPDCIPLLSPQRWEMTRVFEDDTAPWTLAECIRTMERLTRPEFQGYKFAFFIDGLDEFVGKHEEVVALLKELASYDHIKICASSRPWNLFQDSFDMSPSLRAEDLTSKDIEIYVHEVFHANPRFCALERLSPERTSDLSQQISCRAAGVFLWVKLAVRELLNGIQDGDRLSDLQRRLDVMPTDLYDFFMKILSTITADGSNNFKQASELFRIRHLEEVSVLAMALADNDDPNCWVKSPVAPSDDEILWAIDSMKRRLNSKTKGLLEVQDNSCSSYLIQNHLGRPVDAKFMARESKVQYLHRTVKDFIETPETMAKLQEHDFDPNLALCKSYVLQVQAFDMGAGRPNELASTIQQALKYAQAIDKSRNSDLHAVLDALNDWMYVAARHNRFRAVSLLKHPPQLPALLPTALKQGFDSWISHCLSTSIKELLYTENKAELNFVVSWLDKHDLDEFRFRNIAKMVQAQNTRNPTLPQDDQNQFQILGASARLQGVSERSRSGFVAMPVLNTRVLSGSNNEENMAQVELQECEMPCCTVPRPFKIVKILSKRQKKIQQARVRIKQRLERR